MASNRGTRPRPLAIWMAKPGRELPSSSIGQPSFRLRLTWPLWLLSAGPVWSIAAELGYI